MERAPPGPRGPGPCRLCLAATRDIRPIFAPGAPGMASRIRACVALEIVEDDGLPAQICKKCVTNIDNWHIFKRVCDESQIKLRDWITEDVSSGITGVKIKKEPYPEESHDVEMTIDASYPGLDLLKETNDIRLQPEGPPILASLGLAPRNEKSNTDPRADWDRVVAIQTLIERDEAVEGSDTSEEADEDAATDLDSDSDQELDSHEEDEDGEDDKPFYKSKDGYVKWAKKPYRHINVDSLKRKTVSGSAGDAANVQTPTQAWSCLISDEMIDLIVEHSNEYIEKTYPAASITDDVKETLTCRTEIKALLGILYLSGIMRPAFYNSSEMWWGDGCGLAGVQLAMTLDRFRLLLKCLRFDDMKTRESRMAVDKIAPVRQIVDDFTSNCKQSYNIGQCATIDERIIPFSGPCSFRKSVKTKRGPKTGIRIYSLVETDTFYTSNIDICTEDGPVDKGHIVYSSGEVTKRLVSHLASSNITVVVKGRSMTLALARFLLNDYGINSVGALQSKHKEVPAVFSSNSRKSYSSMFGFSDKGTTIVSYIHPKRKACIIMSTRSDHYHSKKLHSSGAPEALVWYKQRKGAAKVAATLAGTYTASRRCSRWPLTVFFSLLDIAAINAQVIWLSNRTLTDVVHRRNFVRSLALGLMNEQVMANTAKDKGTPYQMDTLLSVRGGPIKGNVTTADGLLHRSRRCKFCPRNADRKTRSYCVSCSNPCCKEHYKHLCICCACALKL